MIDTNRMSIVQERLSVNRRIGIDLRKEYSSLYSLGWEIDHTLPILEGIMNTQIWYVKNRDYDTAVGLKVTACNLMIVSNIKTGDRPREMMKIAVC